MQQYIDITAETVSNEVSRLELRVPGTIRLIFSTQIIYWMTGRDAH